MLILKMWSQKVKLTIRPTLLKAWFMLTNVNYHRNPLVSANHFWATGPRTLVYLHHYSNPTSPDNKGSTVLCVIVLKCLDKMPLCKHFHKSCWKLKSTLAMFTTLHNVRKTSACKWLLIPVRFPFSVQFLFTSSSSMLRTSITCTLSKVSTAAMTCGFNH